VTTTHHPARSLEAIMYPRPIRHLLTAARSWRPLVYLLIAGLVAATLAACSSSGTSSGSSSSSGTSSASSAASLGLITPGVLKVGTTSNSKPYEYINGSGNLTGFDVDLVNAVAAKMGVKAQFVTQDFSSLLASVNNHQFDMAAASIAITKIREQLVDFTDGYLVGYLGVMAPPNSGITSRTALAGKRVAVIQGTIEDTYAPTYIPGAQIVRFPDANSAFLALQDHSVAAYFNDYVVDQSYQKQYASLHLQIPVKVAALNLPAGWAVHKGNTKLIAALNKALKQVVADGTWTRLYKEYFPSVPLTPLPPYTHSVGGASLWT
jgi:polar amino acid transport system substrate-binding protein